MAVPAANIGAQHGAGGCEVFPFVVMVAKSVHSSSTQCGRQHQCCADVQGTMKQSLACPGVRVSAACNMRTCRAVCLACSHLLGEHVPVLLQNVLYLLAERAVAVLAVIVSKNRCFALLCSALCHAVLWWGALPYRLHW